TAPKCCSTAGCALSSSRADRCGIRIQSTPRRRPVSRCISPAPGTSITEVYCRFPYVSIRSPNFALQRRPGEYEITSLREISCLEVKDLVLEKMRQVGTDPEL